jgi:hypothetical protein
VLVACAWAYSKMETNEFFKYYKRRSEKQIIKTHPELA